MDRGELRAMVRRLLTEKQSEQIADIEMNSLVNQAQTTIAMDLGGDHATSSLDMSTNGDGTVDLPSDCIRVLQVRYSGARVGRISHDDIYDIDETG